MSLGDDIAASYSEDERRAANSAIVAAYRANGIIGAKMASLRDCLQSSAGAYGAQFGT